MEFSLRTRIRIQRSSFRKRRVSSTCTWYAKLERCRVNGKLINDTETTDAERNRRYVRTNNLQIAIATFQIRIPIFLSLARPPCRDQAMYFPCFLISPIRKRIRFRERFPLTFKNCVTNVYIQASFQGMLIKAEHRLSSASNAALRRILERFHRISLQLYERFFEAFYSEQVGVYIFVICHFILYAKSKGLVTVVPDETATISLFEEL